MARRGKDVAETGPSQPKSAAAPDGRRGVSQGFVRIAILRSCCCWPSTPPSPSSRSAVSAGRHAGERSPAQPDGNLAARVDVEGAVLRGGLAAAREPCSARPIRPSTRPRPPCGGRRRGPGRGRDGRPGRRRRQRRAAGVNGASWRLKPGRLGERLDRRRTRPRRRWSSPEASPPARAAADHPGRRSGLPERAAADQVVARPRADPPPEPAARPRPAT